MVVKEAMAEKEAMVEDLDNRRIDNIYGKESVSQLDETDFFLRGFLIFEEKICLKVAF